jgi:hypothetical protein
VYIYIHSLDRIKPRTPWDNHSLNTPMFYPFGILIDHYYVGEMKGHYC